MRDVFYYHPPACVRFRRSDGAWSATMEHRALRKYRGPETWALVREAYLRGEPAPAVARRFDVGLANLRKRARAEGWTRRRHASTTDAAPVRWATPTLPPGEAALPPASRALSVALSLATEALLSGRRAEALATLRAAETLNRLTAQIAADRARLTGEAEPPDSKPPDGA